jgi:hypothetical protein
MAKQFVLHHQPGRAAANRFVLLKKHANNTADFGLEDGTVVVEGCPIGLQEDVQRSYCLIVDESAAKAAKPSKAELKKIAVELRQKANAAKEAFDKAAEAAEQAGPDAENSEALALAAIEAEDAYKEADAEADKAEAALK